MNKLQDAGESVLVAKNLDPNNQEVLKLIKHIQHAHIKSGRYYQQRVELAKAKEFAKQALILDDTYQPAIDFIEDIKQEYYAQALTYIEKKDHISAIKSVKRTLEIVPKFKEGHFLLGEIYLSIGKLEVAEKEAKTVLRIDPNYKPVSSLLSSIKEKYYNRGLTSLKQNEWQSAEKYAKEALRIAPNYHPTSVLLKQAYYEQGVKHIRDSRYAESINVLQQANDIDPNCEKTHYNLGRAYYKLSSLKEAQLSVKQALSIQPDYLQANKLLSEINHPRNWLKLGAANVRHFTRRILKLNQK